MSTTDIKKAHRARHLNVEPSHATSLTSATVYRADNLYRTGKSFIGPAGWIKSVMARLYQTCRLLLIQSKIPYLYDNPSGQMTYNDVELTSMRRDYVASTSIQHHLGTKCSLGCYMFLSTLFCGLLTILSSVVLHSCPLCSLFSFVI